MIKVPSIDQKINVEKEMHVAEYKMLSRFEVLRHANKDIRPSE
jgi:hypothetical protein